MGVHVGDLDGISLALIDSWARAYSKVTVIDEYLQANGIIHNGEVDPALRLYFQGINVSRLALSKLEEHLSRQVAPDASLQDYIDQQYGSNGE